MRGSAIILAKESIFAFVLKDGMVEHVKVKLFLFSYFISKFQAQKHAY